MRARNKYVNRTGGRAGNSDRSPWSRREFGLAAKVAPTFQSDHETRDTHTPALLGLPRELRDLIYEYCFSLEGNYAYDFPSNKLIQDNGRPIDLSLLHVCRQITAEAQVVPLQVNTLVFKTFHSHATEVQAGLLHATHRSITSRKLSLLNASAQDLLTLENARTAQATFPQFAPLIDLWRSHGEVRINNSAMDCGEAPSIWRDFVAFTLDLVSRHPDFAAKAKLGGRRWRPYELDQALVLNDASSHSWRILKATEIKRLAKEVTQVTIGMPCTWPDAEYRYSAASSSLRFLDSIPNSVRGTIRKIMLLEDHQSVADPAGHARGLIAFCQDHPRMRVQRVVSLWRTIFPVAARSLTDFLTGSDDLITEGLLEDERCPASQITKSVGVWIKEATVLPSLGMPKGCFELVLDGEPTPEHSSHVLAVIHRDIAWQDALDACYDRGILPRPSWLDRRLNRGYMFEGLPNMVRSLSLTSPLIRTNFPVAPVETPDVENLIGERNGWSAQDWEQGWATHEPHEFQTEAPLPPWHLLCWRQVWN